MMAASQALHGITLAREREAEMLQADRLFDAVSLWSREDLDLRLGEREQGSYRLHIDRPLPTLYTVVVRDSLDRELLRTSLFRPEAARDPL